MTLLNKLFGLKKRNTANIAKERLQIIISHERSKYTEEDFLVPLQQEIVEVIAKYVKIDKDKVKVQLEHNGDNSILELNVSMPDPAKSEPELAIVD